MFNFRQFSAILKTDNPTYERFFNSELHGLVTLLQSGSYTAEQIAPLMKGISGSKWGKYSLTRAYLLAEIPGLAGLVKASLMNFKTFSLTATQGGIINHVGVWESDSGRLQDLAHVLTREKVTWTAASEAAREFLHADYQVVGQHFGSGNKVVMPGDRGRMEDNHAILGAWEPRITNLRVPISCKVSQVYQYSDDNRLSWHDIPDSTYEIIRSAAPAGARIRLDMLKRSVLPNRRRESCSNTLLL